MKHNILLAVLGLGLVADATAAAVVYTDKLSWETAIGGGATTEDFSDAILNGFSVSFIGTGHSAPGQGVSGGVLNDRLVIGSATNFSFSGPIFAFGANWDLTPGGQGHGLKLFYDGNLVAQEIANSFSGGFFGVVSSTAFDNVIVNAGSSPAVAETYRLDNLVFKAPANSVPEPSTLGLLGLSILGVFAARRRKAQAK